MQTVLIVVHLIIVLALIAVVLMQRSEGGLGLGGGGSGGVSGFMTGRGQASALTRATAILAALFFVTSMTLAYLSHHSAAPRSIFDGANTGQQQNQPSGQAPQNADNLLDTLRQQGGGANPGAAPAPAVPAPQAPASQTPASQVPAPQAPAPAAPTPAVPDAPQSR